MEVFLIAFLAELYKSCYSSSYYYYYLFELQMYFQPVAEDLQ
jgi:hypothetical protein